MRKSRSIGRPSSLNRTTPVPNWVLDEAMPDLSDTELRVLLVVARSTLGWQEGKGRKESDWLSHHQLQVRTGRSSAVVSRAIEGLVKRGLLIVTNVAGQPLTSPKARSRARGRLYFRLQEPNVMRDLQLANPHRDGGEGESPPDLNAFRAQRMLLHASKSEVSVAEITSNASPQKIWTTKETGTKEIKNIGSRVITLPVPTLENEVSAVAYEEMKLLEMGEHEAGILTPREENDQMDGVREGIINSGTDGNGKNDLVLTAEAKRFITTFDSAYQMAMKGGSPPLPRPEAAALLERRLNQCSVEELEAWLPWFFECNFGYVRRRQWSLESYLESFRLLQAKNHAQRNKEPQAEYSVSNSGEPSYQ